ncbi:M23 family metallopeptidase [Streptomyces apocyni]|uniref:M23 family metallopeptidase n=1 Tax=Streptomyces apocyni TaxID=2654677 RepID=UPI0012EA58DD|nr:M23 family metallopeptidase [Streptomyces apocyni]
MSLHKVLGSLYRLFTLAFAVLVVASIAFDLRIGWWVFLPLVLGVGCVIANGRLAAHHHKAAPRQPIEVDPPVTGRWSALNSPADRTPSHGTHQLGQTYAIDIVSEPEGAPRPGFAWLWPLARSPRAFPAFGAPLYAAADATVVAATDRQRDHLSRNSLLLVLWLLLAEGELRGLVGSHRVLGNHVVLDLGDGVYAAYAHLRQGSLAVRPGDRVTAGQLIGRCGNSGNSSEPHLHFQLMDSPDVDTARGIPFTWRGVGVPGGGEKFTVGDASAVIMRE